MSSQKSSKARGTTGGRDPLGHSERPSHSAGLSGGGTGPSDVLPPPRGLGPARCAGDRRAHDACGGEESLGFLEVLRSTPAQWASVESQTALACVLPTAIEPATAHEETAARPGPSTARRRAATECGLGRGLYE